MSGFAVAVALSLALGQVSPGSVSAFDEGAVVGRVCDDLDGDGVCAASEPGRPGVRVMLETGLVAVTDSQGRFHLGSVATRTFEAAGSGEGRLSPMQHRVRVDPRQLPAQAQVRPGGVTVDVPMGGLAWVEFAVNVPAGSATVARDPAPPRLELRGAGVSWELRVRAPEGVSLRVAGREAPSAGGVHVTVVDLADGPNFLPISARSPGGRVEFWLQPVDVVVRASSRLVVPRPLELIGAVQVAGPEGGQVQFELEPGARATVDSAVVVLDAQGRGAAQVAAGAKPVVSVDAGGRARWAEVLEPEPMRGVLAVGLLELELGLEPSSGALRLAGRGAGSVRAALGELKLGADVELRDADLDALRAGGLRALAPRRLDRFERTPEQGVMPLAWADSSAATASNTSEAPVRAEASWGQLARLGFGGWRAAQVEGETGRFHRAFEAAYLSLATPREATFGLEAKGFAAPALGDVRTGLRRVAAHERFGATGGSLFLLSHGSVVSGSDFVRIELRDPQTGTPLGEEHLLRGRDYTLEPLSGRLMLARPLSFFAGAALLTTDPLTSGATPVLQVDYEHLEVGAAAGSAFGAELRGRAGPVSVGAGVVKDGAYALTSARASTQVGRLWASAEAARSEGPLQGVSSSDDGGFDVLRRAAAEGSGWASTVRLRSAGYGGQGHVDAAWRFREAGYQDSASAGSLRQWSLRAEQPIGSFVVGGVVDQRSGEDPRFPTQARSFSARLLGVTAGWEREAWGVRAEVRDRELESDPTGAGPAAGGRLSAGVSGRYRLLPWLTVRASHRQRLVERGGGEGAWNDSFTSAGVDAEVQRGAVVGLRGGFGPVLGPQVWGRASVSRGDETWYGLQSLDVDSSSGGDRRLVTGVRKELGPGTAVFVEDLVSHDADAFRLARAVAASQKLGDALTVSARFERGTVLVADVAPSKTRDAGGVGVGWESARVRLFARGEGRVEQGAASLTQWFAAAGGEATLTDSLQAAARVVFAHTTRADLLVARALDASASLAWRFGSGAVVARYAFVQDRAVDSLVERRIQVLSLLPALRLGSRFSLAGGLHGALDRAGVLVSASLRPVVRLVGGLDVAVEVARRTSAPDGGELTALRGELGWRFDERLRLAAGYTAFGFSGTGLDAGAPGSHDRAYLRGEAAW